MEFGVVAHFSVVARHGAHLAELGLELANATCGFAGCAEGLRPSGSHPLTEPDFRSSRRLSLRDGRRHKTREFCPESRRLSTQHAAEPPNAPLIWVAVRHGVPLRSAAGDSSKLA